MTIRSREMVFAGGMAVVPGGRVEPADFELGAMMGGQPFAEDRLLSLAGAYQAVTDWHRLRAPDPQDVEAGEGQPAPAPRLDIIDIDLEGE